MGVFPVGKGRQTMTFEWPRPCRYADLANASQSGALPDLALIADGYPQEFAKTIRTWRSTLPCTRLSIFHTPDFAEAVVTAIGADASITATEVMTYRSLSHNTQAATFPVWATCAPYDAHGALVKNDLESIAYDISRRNHGIYLAHDPAYGVVRWFDAGGLRDRLRYRCMRLLIYRCICRIGLGLAWICSFASQVKFRWRKVR